MQAVLWSGSLLQEQQDMQQQRLYLSVRGRAALHRQQGLMPRDLQRDALLGSLWLWSHALAHVIWCAEAHLQDG